MSRNNEDHVVEDSGRFRIIETGKVRFPSHTVIEFESDSGAKSEARSFEDCSKHPFGKRPFSHGIGSAFDLYGIQFRKAGKWWLGRTASEGFALDRKALHGDSVKAYYKWIGRTKTCSTDARIPDKLESGTDPRSKV